MKLLELIEQRPTRKHQVHFFTYLYALRDSGVINMMHAHLALAKNFFQIDTTDDWGNFSSRTQEALENREELNDALEIVKHWMKECEAGGKDNDPTFDQAFYDDQLECIEDCGY